MTTSLRRAAGSLLVVGLSGTELTGLERAWLKLVSQRGLFFSGAISPTPGRPGHCWVRLRR